MKQKVLTIIFALICFIAYAQSGTVEIDTLQKVVGIVIAIGGVYIGYTTTKTAQKLAEQEIKFSAKIEALEEKIEMKFDSRIKDVEAKMATRHDINNLRQYMALQHENQTQANKSLEKQLDLAALIYKKDKHE